MNDKLIDITVYNLEDGIIKYNLSCNESLVETVCNEGESYIIGTYSSKQYKIENEVAISLSQEQLDEYASIEKVNKKNKLLNSLANIRYTKETGGIIWSVNNLKIQTDDRSQTKLLSMYTLIKNNDYTTDINWKLENGDFTILSTTEFLEIITSVNLHISKCFNIEKIITDILNNENTDLDNINLDDLWNETWNNN